MDSSECTTQYVSGMANVMTCDESLYHRLQNPERQKKGKFEEKKSGEQKMIYLHNILKLNTTKIKVI